MKWTLNTVWYLFLEVLQNAGVKVPTRGYVKGLVTKLCKIKGVTRESLGIFAGVRTELYFNGNWTSVSFDSVNELAKKGTDIIFIEKEGIPEVLTDFADRYGIAMVNTRGHLTEYGKDLMEVAKEAGAHVVIMADYDATGVKIASESPTEMPWIGANDRMLEYFSLSRESVAIDSENRANKEYVRYLVQNGKHQDKKDLDGKWEKGELDARFKDVDVDFLDSQRVELDSILAKVGDERFFQYIMDTLKGLYPKRDYNRAIEIPSKELGAKHEEILDTIDRRVESIISGESEKIKNELGDVSGFIDVKEKLKEIKERLRKVLADNPNYEDFAKKLNELVETHPFCRETRDEKSSRWIWL